MLINSAAWTVAANASYPNRLRVLCSDGEQGALLQLETLEI